MRKTQGCIRGEVSDELSEGRGETLEGLGAHGDVLFMSEGALGTSSDKQYSGITFQFGEAKN